MGQSKGQPKTFDCVMALLIARVARVTKGATVALGWESRVDWIAWMALVSLNNVNHIQMNLTQYHYPYEDDPLNSNSWNEHWVQLVGQNVFAST